MVLVDTSVWSLVFRRRAAVAADQHVVAELEQLIDDTRAVMAGCIRQEILSGISKPEQFERLRDALEPFEDLAAERATYELAAMLFNRCRARGVQGSHVDFLICALASQHGVPVFTVDADFQRYAQPCGILLHQATVVVSGEGP
jgi:hypothetical protein